MIDETKKSYVNNLGIQSCGFHKKFGAPNIRSFGYQAQSPDSPCKASWPRRGEGCPLLLCFIACTFVEFISIETERKLRINHHLESYYTSGCEGAIQNRFRKHSNGGKTYISTKFSNKISNCNCLQFQVLTE